MNDFFKPALPMRRGDRLAGKVAVVTGIGAGIGRGIARLYAMQGATVLGCDVDAAAAQATVDAAQAEGLALQRDRKSTRLNSSHSQQSRMPSSA